MSNETVTKQTKYQRLVEELEASIRAGKLQPGDRLPSFSEMQRLHGAATATVQRVYAELEQQNLIERRNGSGIYVADVRAQKSHVIGVLTRVRPNWNHPYHHRLLSAFFQCATENYYETLVLNSISSIAWERMDAVISVRSAAQEFEDRLPPLMPFVSLTVPVAGKCSVLIDETDGVRKLTSHLLKLGHRRIAILLPDHGYSRQMRLAGYEEALQEAGISPKPQWMRNLWSDDSDSYSKYGYVTMSEWLQKEWSKTGCTALITQNDDTAIGAIRALREHGLDVPSDVSVTGFDGTEIGLHVEPALTTINVPLEQAGKAAFDLLQQQIRTGEITPQTVMLETKLCERASTALVKS
jgi:LacI family transcriptional regulator